MERKCFWYIWLHYQSYYQDIDCNDGTKKQVVTYELRRPSSCIMLHPPHINSKLHACHHDIIYLSLFIIVCNGTGKVLVFYLSSIVYNLTCFQKGLDSLFDCQTMMVLMMRIM
jgi:hypothetical protein